MKYTTRMRRLGLFVIPIRFDESISTYNDYIDFLVESEVHGYTHVYIGEHLTDSREDIQSSMIFAAAILARTKKLKVCLAVLPLPHYEIKLLVKQLEDLYKLGQGRIDIGFSAGALKSDAEYMGFEHTERGSIFNSKIASFMENVSKSSVLNEMLKPQFFSTILSPYPVKSSTLFKNNFSAITSNFTHCSLWENHIKCLTKGDMDLALESKWHIALNLIPDSGLSENSQLIIKESLLYIYEKLVSCGLNIMLPSRKTPSQDNETLKNILYSELVFSKIPSQSMRQIKQYKKFLGHPIVNLFDCLTDACYVKYIYLLPEIEPIY